MFRALKRLFGRVPDRTQLAFDFDAVPATGEELLLRLRSMGLVGIHACRLTRNRTVAVSFRAGELRVHQDFRAAPPEILEALVTFVCGRRRSERRAAQARLVAYPITAPTSAAMRRPEQTAPADEPLARKLSEWHGRYNAEHFAGTLRDIPIRVSRRMRSRLGHYTAASPTGEVAEIVISRRHARRHGLEEALGTLLHEMVHQWQDEQGLPLDHGRGFRDKARSVGIPPAARRAVVSTT